MKLVLRSRAGQEGTALMVTLFLCTFLFMIIAGYLMNARHQQFIGYRAQVWNMTIPAAESGIEEGLQHINMNSEALTTGGWTQSGSTYQRTHMISDDSHYVVTIDAFDIDNPIITSVGYHDAPVFGDLGRHGVLATTGTTTEGEDEIARRISRTIEVRATRNAGLFLGALIAREGVDLNGNGVLTDSFISTDPLHSNNGMYPAGDPAKLRSRGDIFVNSSLLNSADVGNSDIYGHLVVGPGGKPNLGPNGGVGTYAWRAAGNDGIQPGFFRDDSNYTFPAIALPYDFGTTPSSGSVTTTNISISSSTTTTASYPSPPPASGVVTNISYATTSVRPSPEPDGLVVNTHTTPTKTKTYPDPGTYLGEVRKNGAYYYYEAITSYSYTYPVYSYTYDTYATNYTTTTETYDYVLEGGDPSLSPVEYYLDAFTGSLFVTGNARLVVTEEFSGEIYIASGGKLEIFTSAPDITLAGNGILNQSGFAANCIIWATPDVESIDFSGNAEITAGIYAPWADLTMNGGGHLPFDFVGSLVIRSATLDGTFSFHYDEALKSHTKFGRYLLSSWNEL